MKKINLFLIAFVLLVGGNAMAQSKSKTPTKVFNAKDYTLFGEKFKVTKILTKDQMLDKYKNLKKGDTITVQFQSTIKSVCKKKGCWMKMELVGDDNSFVKFKDYGFFVPLNADNSKAIVNGKAFVDVVSVEELKHYAKDGGKSEAEIAKITKPEVTYSFLADGVYIKK
ncbi:DUF4920 domain-containing protein [Flavobacterium sp. UBA7682]|uniref:DUF4920 domain-containing protein n=1 Tax=Flavobacterium sp. UBA7682 TaxID=1946560 RepID=UPI0025BA45CA|nr:DUF4920 domain-containing protein [Flavobacterium sp. UBA7682]